MDEYSNRELYILIQSEFKETHKRLDLVNGKLSKHETRITKIENWKNKLIGAFIITNLVFLPVMFFVITIIVKNI